MQINFFENNKFKQELFNKALLLYKKEDKISWTKNIVNTNLPLIAIDSKGIENIVKAIPKDLKFEFLDNVKFDYHESTIVYAKILNTLKSCQEIAKYLLPFAEFIDNWASCDTLAFNLKGKEKEELFDLALNYVKSDKAFCRRVGFRILFRFIEDKYIDKIFDAIEDAFFEKEYYVNMIVAWLLCEMFIKSREKTLAFARANKLNDFVKNKFISKCNDSFRVSKEDKTMLKTLKN